MTDVEGLVDQRRDRGVKVQGEWYSVSKFKPVELPSQGSLVRLEADDKRFIKTITVLSTNGSPMPHGSQVPVGLPSQRDATITRLTCLKAAATFCAAKAQVDTGVKSSDVLKIAESWVEWVEQS